MSRSSRSREIVTIQLGPFSNYAGAHFWNTQDDARNPLAGYDEDTNEPLFDEKEARTATLWREGINGAAPTPRLVACDAIDGFGSLGLSGGVAVPSKNLTSAAAIDPLSWGGSVAEVAQETREAHAFAQMMAAPIVGGLGGPSYGDAYDVADAEDEEEEEEEEETEEESADKDEV